MGYHWIAIFHNDNIHQIIQDPRGLADRIREGSQHLGLRHLKHSFNAGADFESLRAKSTDDTTLYLFMGGKIYELSAYDNDGIPKHEFERLILQAESRLQEVKAHRGICQKSGDASVMSVNGVKIWLRRRPKLAVYDVVQQAEGTWKNWGFLGLPKNATVRKHMECSGRISSPDFFTKQPIKYVLEFSTDRGIHVSTKKMTGRFDDLSELISKVQVVFEEEDESDGV